MVKPKRVRDGTPWQEVFGYSRAVVAGDLVMVSGTTGTDQYGGVVGYNQMYLQARAAIDKIAAALASLGLTLADVVRTRVFVTDLSRFEEVARAHREAFGENPPASTVVEVRRLVRPEMLIEIEADAWRDPGRATDGEAAGPKSAVAPARGRSKAKPRSKRLSLERGAAVLVLAASHQRASRTLRP